MNILFFLIPKRETVFLYDDNTVTQAIELMERRHFTAVPVLNRKGGYVGGLTEGDLLYDVRQNHGLEISNASAKPIRKVKRRWNIEPVRADADMEDLVALAMNQNFVPVVDDNDIFIGIIPRKAIIEYCYRNSTLKENT